MSEVADATRIERRTQPDVQLLYERYGCPADQTRMYGRAMIVRRAEGCRVWFCGDDEPYLDLVSGYSATNLGHAHPRLRRKLAELAGRFDQVHSLTSAPAVQLSARLCGLMGDPEDYGVYTTAGGAAAVDVAVRLCRAASGKGDVASLDGAFHGFSLGALPLTDPAYVAADAYGPLAGRRCALPVGDLDACRRILDAQRASVGGVIVEPVQGAAGFIIPPEGFLAGLRKLCRERDLVFIADEIQVGLGRTGRLLALDHSGVTDPDIVLLSKSLAGGYYPLSAVVARREIFESAPAAGPGLGDTFSHSPVGCGLALEVMDILETTDVIADGCARGAEMLSFLHELAAAHPRIARVWGVGAALGLEIAGNDPRALAERIVRAGLDEHVLLYATGPAGNRLKFAPPLTLTPEETADACDRIARAVQTALG